MTSDEIKTHEIVNLLYDHFGSERGRYVCATEVGDVPCGANRRMDFVAVDCWSSGGFDISAFEIKISKSDLRNDLEHPEKHNIFFDQIDRFSLIAPEYVLDSGYKSMIPPKWGIVSVSRETGDDGKQVLRWKNVRRPMALVDDAQAHRSFNRAFAASIIRRCVSSVQAAADAECARLREEVNRSRQAASGGTDWEKLYRDANHELSWMRDFCWKCGIYSRNEQRIKRMTRIIAAAKRVEYGSDLMENAVEALKKNADDAVKAAKTLIAELERESKDPPEQPPTQAVAKTGSE